MSAELAVVVGAAGEIGSAITAGLVGRGVDVLAVGRDERKLEELRERIGTGLSVCVADITDDASTAVIAAALDRTVAMVVHSPGVPVAGGVLAVPTEAILNACNVKVAGFLRVVRAVDTRLRRQSRLVAIGGHYGFEPSPYAATAGVGNAALANLVRQLSWAYGDRGVTAHLVAPGPADTERLRRVAGDRAKLAGTDPEVEFEAMRKDSAIGALTTPDQVAWAVRNLLDPEADALAGSALMLDSGRRKGLP